MANKEKKTKFIRTAKKVRLDIRLSESLKTELEEYCCRTDQSITSAIVYAIKSIIRPHVILANEKKKEKFIRTAKRVRMDIRIPESLKTELEEYCRRPSPSKTKSKTKVIVYAIESILRPEE